jgi:hypothetical protein
VSVLIRPNRANNPCCRRKNNDLPVGLGSPLAPIMGYPVPDARQAAKVRSKPSGGGLG